jgi:hypothetical protein
VAAWIDGVNADDFQRISQEFKPQKKRGALTPLAVNWVRYQSRSSPIIKTARVLLSMG